MTAVIRYVSDQAELTALWSQIWPLIEAFQQHHARMLGGVLRPGREERALKHITTDLQTDRYWLQVAQDGDDIVGMGSARIIEPGVTEPGPVGYTGDVYLKPAARGEGLMWRMTAEREEVLRTKGMKVRESSINANNSRIFEIWGTDTWGCSLRRPVTEKPGAATVPGSADIRRVLDFEADWPQLWRLLAETGAEDEAAEKHRLCDVMEKRGAIFLAGSPAVAFVAGRVSVNPWLFVERVGIISQLVANERTGDGLTNALVARIERWMASKQSTSIQTEPLPHSQTAPWLARGYQPYMYRRRKLLEP